MACNGNLLFHYTTLDNAVKIILTNSLLFGSFKDMNDISESKRIVLSEIGFERGEKILSEYQAICFTCDNADCRGFAIDCLWGYYAEKGVGVCLVFDRNALLPIYDEKFREDGFPKELSIRYIDENSNLVPLKGANEEEIKRDLLTKIGDVFYTKDKCWEHENELRLIAHSSKQLALPLGDSLTGAIFCSLREADYHDCLQYRLLSELTKLRKFRIYHYESSLGNKELQHDDDIVWPVYGRDFNHDEDGLIPKV